MNNNENKNVEVLEEIANTLSIIGEHLGNISNDMSSILEQLEDNAPKAIKQLSYIAENTGNII